MPVRERRCAHWASARATSSASTWAWCPSWPIAMLACARIGAPHVVVFGGFSAEALGERLESTGREAADHPGRGLAQGRARPPQADRRRRRQAGADRRAHGRAASAPASDVPMRAGRDHWWHDVVAGQPTRARAEPMEAEHMLFALHTSGTTAKPKAAVHTSRRLPDLRRRHPPLDLRHSRRRRVLVRRRHRLGDRPQLHRVRAAAQRHHRHPLRGRPDVSRAPIATGRSSSATR